MSVAYRALVGSQNPTPQQRRHPVRPGQNDMRRFARSGNGCWMVDISMLTYLFVVRQTVSADNCSCRSDSLYEGNQAIAGNAGNSTHPYSSNRFPSHLSGYCNKGFFLGFSPNHSGFLAPNICFINFHFSSKLVHSRPHHCPSHLMKPTPCGLIAPKTHNPLQFQCANALLRICDMPHSLKPHPDRFSRPLEYRSSRGGCLLSAGIALKGSSRRLTSLG